MFKGANRLVRLVARDGLKVRVRCDVNFYPPNGRLQLIVKHMAEAWGWRPESQTGGTQN